jgi:polyisoprenoid-binding protein YceI
MISTHRMISIVACAAALAVASPAFAGKGVTSALKGVQTIVIAKDARNQMEWLSDAPGEKIRGSAPGVTGTVTVDPADLSTVKGKLIVPVKTMKTGNDTRDRHVRGKKWLGAKQFPNIIFEIQRVTDIAGSGAQARFKAHGKFTLHGVTKKLSAPITLKWKDKGAGAKVKIEVKFNIALADYNIQGKRGMVGDKVGKVIKIWGNLYGATR